MKRVSFEEFMSFEPCWKEEDVKEIYDQYPDGMTALDILHRPGVNSDDKLWAVLRPEFIDDNILHEFALICAEYVLSLIDNADPRSVEAIKVKRLWLRGEASDDKLNAAWVAARKTARDTAWAATWAAIWVDARVAAWATAKAVAMEATWNTQAAVLEMMITEDNAGS